jgi:hypothetical protein
MKAKTKCFRKNITLLLKYDIQSFAQPLKVTIICLTIFFSFIYIIFLWEEATETLQHFLSWITLYVCGIPLIVTTFKEIFNTPRNYSYLTLPFSNSEKFLSKIILSTVFCISAVTLYGVVFTLVATLICEPILHLSFGVFTPFTKSYFLSIGIYLTLFPLILFISSYYKKYARGKVLFYVGVAAIMLLLIWYFNESLNMPFGQNHPISPHFTNIGSFSISYPHFTNLFKYYQWIVFAPLFWTLYYREFRKLEV